ncbi:hypothetical protein LAC81_27470 [Ensifer adhaerens]|nr:hypothetical protein [Ensifer adhaerens]MBZ7924473.1 hypothetical protein [Ensifer adhaerens]UAX96285.1 hypothetical protein LAC78_21010 [Ensifer adhaerens]UAY04372.1 hypothetical protein LAC80_23950 [Ensifer adhaerens]UAY12357.1 hypothetical protein LAC81_27470 [Ensifer adhaerens]
MGAATTLHESHRADFVGGKTERHSVYSHAKGFFSPPHPSNGIAKIGGI